MAGIDKIYGSQKQYEEFYAWCERYAAKKFLDYFYPRDGYNEDDRPITNFPTSYDRWLWHMCPLKFVREGLKYQYGEYGPTSKRKSSKRFFKPKRHPGMNYKTWALYRAFYTREFYFTCITSDGITEI